MNKLLSLTVLGIFPMLDFASLPAMAAASISASGVVDVSIVPGRLVPIELRTFPDASCLLIDPSHAIAPLAIYADDDGSISLFASSETGKNFSPSTRSVQCSMNGRTQAFTLRYALGNNPQAFAPRSPALPTYSLPIGALQAFEARFGIDPRSATDAQLEARGFAPRPGADERAAGYRSWYLATLSPTNRVFAHAGPSVSSPSSQLAQRALLSPASPAGTSSGLTELLYAGFSLTGSQGSYNTIQAYWTVPTVTTLGRTGPGGTYQSSLEVALDGSGGSCYSGGKQVGCSGDYFVDGTEQDFTIGSGGATTYNYYSWYANDVSSGPSTTSRTQFLGTKPGDSMYCTVYKQTQNNQVNVIYYCKDLTTGNVGSYTALNVGSALVGDSAEFVAARSDNYSTIQALADFQTATFTDAVVKIGTSYFDYANVPSQGAFNIVQYTMVNRQNGTDATAQSTSSSAIQFNYVTYL